MSQQGISIFAMIEKGYLHSALAILFPGDNPENVGIAATIERSILDGHISDPGAALIVKESRNRRVKMTIAEIDAYTELVLKTVKDKHLTSPIVMWRDEVSDRVYSEWASRVILDYLLTFIVNLDPDIIKVAVTNPGGIVSTTLGNITLN